MEDAPGFVLEPPEPGSRKLNTRPVPREVLYPLLTIDRILEWADAHFARTGRWPNVNSGRVPEAPRETWKKIAEALLRGGRGLPHGLTLAKLLFAYRGVRNKGALPPLTEELILQWADAHFARTGEWPNANSGPIPEAVAPGETWKAVHTALQLGYRGLPGGTTLFALLAERRGAQSRGARPPLTVEQILAWADAHHARTGAWPTVESGAIPEAADETWAAVNAALGLGLRGLPGGSSLRKLLHERRGKYDRWSQAPLTIEQILAWADAHHARTGSWPGQASGAVADAPGESWSKIQACLRLGLRGLEGGSSIAKLLREHGRGRRDPRALPLLTEALILEWADAHHARTGEWPGIKSGPIAGVPGETWCSVHNALFLGTRGLEPGSSLPNLLFRHRGVRSQRNVPLLSEAKIVAWADAHYHATGRWPNVYSDLTGLPPGETWRSLNSALQQGLRGLPGGSSLAKLLESERRVRRLGANPLTESQILEWADAYHLRYGRWPNADSGPIYGVRGETWRIVDGALRSGSRGLSGDSSLARLLARCRGARNRGALPPLTVEQIVAWAEAHFRRTGRWPNAKSGSVEGAPGETWSAVWTALGKGKRGLPGGSSLARLRPPGSDAGCDPGVAFGKE